MFMHYKNEVKNQLNKEIKVLRSDKGGEYESPFGEFCSQHGIIHQTILHRIHLSKMEPLNEKIES